VLGVGFALEGSVAAFLTIAIAQAVRALGFALIGGAQEAWIADELAKEDSERDLTDVFLRGAQMSQLGTIAGAVLSGVAATLSYRLPFLISGGLFVLLGAFLIPAMTEHGFHRPQRGPEAGKTFREARKATVESARKTWRAVRMQSALLS